MTYHPSDAHDGKGDSGHEKQNSANFGQIDMTAFRQISDRTSNSAVNGVSEESRALAVQLSPTENSKPLAYKDNADPSEAALMKTAFGGVNSGSDFKNSIWAKPDESPVGTSTASVSQVMAGRVASLNRMFQSAQA